MALANKSLYVTPGTSSGDPIAGYTSTVGGVTRDYQTVLLAEPSGHIGGSLATYHVFCETSCAANRHHITFFVTSGSTQTMKIRKLFPVVMSTAAITGVDMRFDFLRVRGVTTAGSTAITHYPSDLSDTTALSTASFQFWLQHTSAGLTEESTFFAQVFTQEEMGVGAAAAGALLMASVNWMPESPYIKPLTLRGGTSGGQGWSVKQISASTVGSLGWYGIITVESS